MQEIKHKVLIDRQLSNKAGIIYLSVSKTTSIIFNVQ